MVPVIACVGKLLFKITFLLREPHINLIVILLERPQSGLKNTFPFDVVSTRLQ